MPVMIDAVRTAIGRRDGALSAEHPVRLLGDVQRTLVERAGIEAGAVEQVIGGCVTQVGEQSFNTTRLAWLDAGLPIEVGASTLDCQCGSSQHACHLISSQISAGAIATGIACGVESMSRVAIGANARGPGKPKPPGFAHELPHQFVAAERIARKHGITREHADEFALGSQTRAQDAARCGRLAAEITPVTVPAPAPERGAGTAPAAVVDHDECPRPSTAAGLARLEPMLEDGIHTAGNTSQISDGAAAVLWMDEALAHLRGLRPRARIRAQVLVGTDPHLHIEGPIDATRRLLAQAGMQISDIDLFEINEAFASVVLAWQRTFDVARERINVNGGSIALGHPMGATGARLIGTAVGELERRGEGTALIAMCCGSAVATGTILERV
ncbi:MAG TPA: steroid 3-ketoacyl-CoA thiolase [Solirubrobacteraceae bacterium]|nr:steroid 3-ketoacyl-CoA thiolase [Solirubrobacteraceae bacterium]